LWSPASVCLSVRRRMPTLLHAPGCNLGSCRGCPLVVHYWADLQSGHGLRCYGNITRTRNVSEYMLVLALCLVKFLPPPRYNFGTGEVKHFKFVCRLIVTSTSACIHGMSSRSRDLFNFLEITYNISETRRRQRHSYNGRL